MLDQVQTAFASMNRQPTRADIDKFLAYYGKPGENQAEKQAKLREVLDQMKANARNGQGIHVADDLESYGNF